MSGQERVEQDRCYWHITHHTHKYVHACTHTCIAKHTQAGTYSVNVHARTHTHTILWWEVRRDTPVWSPMFCFYSQYESHASKEFEGKKRSHTQKRCRPSGGYWIKEWRWSHTSSLHANKYYFIWPACFGWAFLGCKLSHSRNMSIPKSIYISIYTVLHVDPKKYIYISILHI